MKPSKPLKPKPHKLSFDAIGTSWTVESDLLNDTSRASIQRVIEVFDHNYSRFRKDSLITHIARSNGIYELPENVKPMLDLYQQLYQITNGAFTPLIGQSLSDTGYDATYRLTPLDTIQAVAKWEDVMRYEHPYLITKEPVLLDFGAGGKGYLADLVAAQLGDNCSVDASGDIVHQSNSNQKLTVALEDPDDSDSAIGIAHIGNQSICGSAGNRRSWSGYNHILDPKTLSSPQTIAATWAVAKTGLIADSLATALYFTNPALLQHHYDFEYAIVYKNRSLTHSKNFPGEFFA